jgi:hypothetical protein
VKRRGSESLKIIENLKKLKKWITKGRTVDRSQFPMSAVRVTGHKVRKRVSLLAAPATPEMMRA